ncbi:MAG: YggS family pyridoxal phosphate-dependent enzyme [Campylobacterota bacterium]
MQQLEQNLDRVITNIEEARLQVNAHHIVKLVGVSKYTDTQTIQALYHLGQRAFGESKVQQLTQRVDELQELPLEWHFIGRLQKNKINHLLKTSPALIHSIDSLELAQAVDKRATTPCNVLLQINSSNEKSKAGVSVESAADTYAAIKESCANLNLRGVMSIGAHSDDTKLIAQSFEKTYKIYEQTGAKICSMGMSSDYELAIKCGSNMVRIGSALYK